MEDYAVYLAEEAKSDIVALHQFKILYDPKRGAYHFFFEGEEDGLYYMPEARRRLGPAKVNTYDCGGKRNVVAVRETLKDEGYDVRFCLFFVDRDFDDFLKTQVEVDEQTYMTDYYSIESDIVSLHSAGVLLEDVVRISRADPEFNRIEAAFAVALPAFYHEIRSLMAWVLAAKETGCSPNLRNTNGLKNIVFFLSMQPILTKAGFAEFKKKVVVNGQVPPMSAVLKWLRVLNRTPPKYWVRGKYEMWFFQVAVLAALDEANLRRRQAGGKAFRVPASLRDGHIFEVLGGRVPPPASLQTFFKVCLH